VEELARRFPRTAPGIEEVQDVVERYGSKPAQVLTLFGEQPGAWAPPVRVDAGYAGGCAAHVCEF
jgi:hypothetical protein